MRDALRDRQQWGQEVMVSTGSSAATLAALEVLAEGGTAFDAAITASAVLTVAMPMSSGPAGDAAVVFHVAGSPAAWSLTGLGRAPAGASIEAFRRLGVSTVPLLGIGSATTPGLLAAWRALHREHGTIPLQRLLRPAITLAERGTVVTAQMARWIAENIAVLGQDEFVTLFASHAAPAAVGTLLPMPGLARLYRRYADSAEEAQWEVDRRVHEVSEQLGGFFAPGDCATLDAEIGPALTANVGGMTVATNPPPTQGCLLLQNLVLYERLADGLASDTADGIHLLTEIIHQSFAWRIEHLGDPLFATIPDPLAEPTLAAMDALVDPKRRSATRYAGHYSAGDTTHFAIVDRAGNGVSWTQSLGLGFGSGVGVAQLGLLLANRLGRSATIAGGDVNRVGPGKRPVNTIFAWSVADSERLRWMGGTPGGDGQCQWNAQLLAALLLDRVDVLAALNRPRWTYLPGADKVEASQPPHLQVDSALPGEIVEALRLAGHTVRVRTSVGGAARVVARWPNSVYGLDDGRQEGLTAGR